jgi:hypothetical protein
MAVFIRQEPSTSIIAPTSTHGLRVHDGTQSKKRLHRDLWAVFNDQRPAVPLIEHPARHQNPQILIPLYDDRRITPRSKSSNHLNFTAKKRVEPVSDPRRSELMSSVGMRCAIPLRRIC